MFLKLAYLPSKLRFSGKYLFQEHQIFAGQLSADSCSTETLYCLNSSSTETVTLLYRAHSGSASGSLGELEKLWEHEPQASRS